MIRTDLSPSTTLAPAFQAATSAAEVRAGGAAAGERFGDFSTFASGAGGETVGLGRGRASIDAQHAARSVTAFLTDG